uniref:Uncharacterized protein n=1 Tax=Aegilops tauschii subsp. strangulata TaxID=200361 RepID=A0A452XVS7_AEGTS
MAASSSKSTTAFIDSVAELPEITSGFGRRGEKRKEKDHSAERERGAKEPSVRVDHQTEVGERRGLGGAAPLCAAFVQEPGIEEGPAHPCNTNISPVAPSSAVQQIAVSRRMSPSRGGGRASKGSTLRLTQGKKKAGKSKKGVQQDPQ